MSVTGGICKKCFPGELEKLRKWKEKKENGRISGGLERDRF